MNTPPSPPIQTAPPNEGLIKVMLVDDSSVVRHSLARIIETDPAITIVASVSDGKLAIESTKSHKPDIIIMDIEMPVMDGLTALPHVLEASPNSKVIMFSALTEKGATTTLKAFTLGAIECVVKPSAGEDVGPGSNFQKNILNLIKGLYPDKKGTTTAATPAQPTTSATPAPFTTKKTSFQLKNDPLAYKGKPQILAIGSSTGGPQALFEVIQHLKGFDIPIVVTQHMPATFTKMLATHIQQHTGVESLEGEEGMIVENGKVYVAPGGFHMKFIRDGVDLKIKIDDGPPENFCKPAVDVMYRSLIEIFDNRVLSVILTGMGSDGLKGGEMLTQKGGRIIAQDQDTSVVWGMPGAVATAGLCSAVLPLNNIGPWIRKAVLG